MKFLSGKNLFLTIIVIILLLLVILFTSPSDFRSEKSVPFDSQNWQQGDKTKRAQMAYDITATDTLIGLDHKQVKILLGDPKLEHPLIYTYHLDFGHSLWPGESWTYYLNVHFDSAGTVTSAGISD